MQGGATFAEVLDEFLQPHLAAAHAPQQPAPARPAPANPFLFSAAYQRGTWSLPKEYVGATAPHAASGVTRSTVSAARPPRRLTAGQQRSFDALIEFGAALPADFSAQELRAAFRALARRYHPDRHPFADAGEVTVLSRQFTAITGHYELLRSALGTTSH